MIEPRTLSGFKDRLPLEAIAKQNLLKQITEVFDSFGFVPIETPHLEYAEILVKQGSEEIQKELYRFQDHGSRDVALRFDLTLPLARFIAQHRHQLPLPFKRYAIGNVFRGERAQRGRYREFTQCDFDFVGSCSVASDSEIIQVMATLMQKLEVGRFCISINHRGVLNGICEALEIVCVQESLRVIDKLDKIGLDGVKQELSHTLNPQQIEKLLEWVSFKEEENEDFFARVAFLKEFNPTLKNAIEELEALYTILRALDLPKECYKINFSIARGLGYYTGIVYETTLLDLPSIGSVCSGGRYDHLVQTFSKESLSGVGASVGLDRLLSALEELGKLQKKSTQAQVICLCMEEVAMPYTQRLAQRLREQGIGTEVYPDCIKIAKQFSYADARGYDFAIIIGEEESKMQQLSLKNLQTAQQYKMIDLQKCLEILGESNA